MSESVPGVGVAVVVMHDREVLLSQREDLEAWCIPGGWIEPHESIAQAGVREVREETGIDVRIVGLVGTCSRPFWTRHGDHLMILAAVPLSHTFVPQPSEVIALDYFALDALPAPMMPHHAAYIRAAFAGERGRLWTTSIRMPEALLDRQALYQWRDELGVSRQQAYYTLLGRLDPFTLTDDIDGTILDSVSHADAS